MRSAARVRNWSLLACSAVVAASPICDFTSAIWAFTSAPICWARTVPSKSGTVDWSEATGAGRFTDQTTDMTATSTANTAIRTRAISMRRT